MDRRRSDDSAERFSAYIDELASVLGHAARVGPMRDYCTGLLLPCARKSVEVPDLIRDRGGDGARANQRSTSIAAALYRQGRVVRRESFGQGARARAAANRAARGD